MNDKDFNKLKNKEEFTYQEFIALSREIKARHARKQNWLIEHKAELINKYKNKRSLPA